jgi:hypothetical protein
LQRRKRLLDAPALLSVIKLDSTFEARLMGA